MGRTTTLSHRRPRFSSYQPARSYRPCLVAVARSCGAEHDQERFWHSCYSCEECHSNKSYVDPAARELEKHVREAILSKDLPRDAALVEFYERLAWSAPCSFPLWLLGAKSPGRTVCSRRSRAMAYPTEALKAETIRCLSYLVQTRH